MRCADCGERADSDLCGPCTEVAETLGWSKPARLAALGVLPLDLVEATL